MSIHIFTQAMKGQSETEALGSGKLRTQELDLDLRYIEACSSLGLSQSPWWTLSAFTSLPMMGAKSGKYISTCSHLS
jgi:hypothetical protein